MPVNINAMKYAVKPEMRAGIRALPGVDILTKYSYTMRMAVIIKTKLIKGRKSGLNNLKFSCFIFFRSLAFIIVISKELALKPII